MAKVKVAKGKSMYSDMLTKIRKKPGSSNAGKYPGVKQSDFAGAAGGASKYSFPINTKKRAKAALAYRFNAPKPDGIKKKVYKKYPSLNPKRKGK